MADLDAKTTATTDDALLEHVEADDEFYGLATSETRSVRSGGAPNRHRRNA